MRIDKWLWAARFFKTRTLASRACDLGRIVISGQPAKPAREAKPGEFVRIRTESGTQYEVEILGLSEIRGPAAVAQTLYRETPESAEARLRLREDLKAMAPIDRVLAGRPNKRDRRQIHRLRGR